MLQGQRDLGDRVEHDPVRARAARLGAARRLLLDDRARRRRRAGAAVPGRLRLRGAQAPLERRSGSARAWSASARRRRSASCSPTCPATTSGSAPGLGESPPLNIIVLPVLFEGSVRAVDRAGVVLAVQRRPTRRFLDQLTESIGLVLNTDRGQHRSPRTCSSSRSRRPRSCARSRRSCASRTRTSREQATLLAEQNIEAEQQEPGGRGGQAPRRGEGRPARGLVEVQVGVHREHVARAAHAAQQPADPGRAARGQPRRQPDRHARSSTRASSARRAATCSSCSTSILDLAKVESGTVDARAQRASRSPSCATACCASSSQSPSARASASRSSSTPAARDDRHRPATPAPDPQEPARQRVQVHRARRGATCSIDLAPSGWSPDDEPLAARRVGHRVQRQRHRHRHQEGAAAARSSRPSPRATARPPASTAAPGSGSRSAASSSACSAARSRVDERARAGQHVHRLPAARPSARRDRRHGRRADAAPTLDGPIAAIAAAGRPTHAPRRDADGLRRRRSPAPRSSSSTTTSATSSP